MQDRRQHLLRASHPVDHADKGMDEQLQQQNAVGWGSESIWVEEANMKVGDRKRDLPPRGETSRETSGGRDL